MKNGFVLFTIVSLYGMVRAEDSVWPVQDTDYYHYDQSTGIVDSNSSNVRFGRSLWAAIEPTGWFYGIRSDKLLLDWGDIASPAMLGGLGLTYYTNSQASDGDNQLFVMLYIDEDGWNSTGRIPIGGLVIENIPGSTLPADQFSGGVWEIDLAGPMVLDGDDLDGDDLADFGYTFWFNSLRTANAKAGPLCVDDPNTGSPTAPGIAMAWDEFLNPDLFNDPGLSNTEFYGTCWI